MVYPRVGGETLRHKGVRTGFSGLSPRGRGNRGRPGRGDGAGGSIPAWAGKPIDATESCLPSRVYPRVGGETRSLGQAELPCQGLSPRGRGNLCVILTHSFAYVKDRWCY